jgi:hypothetical protein
MASPYPQVRAMVKITAKMISTTTMTRLDGRGRYHAQLDRSVPNRLSFFLLRWREAGRTSSPRPDSQSRRGDEVLPQLLGDATLSDESLGASSDAWCVGELSRLSGLLRGTTTSRHSTTRHTPSRLTTSQRRRRRTPSTRRRLDAYGSCRRSSWASGRISVDMSRYSPGQTGPPG